MTKLFPAILTLGVEFQDLWCKRPAHASASKTSEINIKIHQKKRSLCKYTLQRKYTVNRSSIFRHIEGSSRNSMKPCETPLFERAAGSHHCLFENDLVGIVRSKSTLVEALKRDWGSQSLIFGCSKDSIWFYVTMSVGSSRADSEKSKSQKSESTWLPGQKLVVMRALVEANEPSSNV